jgi:ferrous iron transport protein A
MNLNQLDKGKKGIVIELQGGQQFVSKLEAMGILRGSTIRKKSASLLRGPVVVEQGFSQLAIGYGIAKRIIVEPLDK